MHFNTPRTLFSRLFSVYVGWAGWGPHAYFQMLAESQNRDEALSANANSLSMQQTELESIYIQSQHGVETSRGYSGDTNPILNGRESGRRSSLG